MSKQTIEKHLTLDELGRKVAEIMKELYPKLHGSISFNFKEGFYCNWEIIERGKSQEPKPLCMQPASK